MQECHVEGCTRNADRIWVEDKTKRICETHLKRWNKTGMFGIDRPEGWGEERNRKFKEGECVHCHEIKKIRAKGLCSACYSRLLKTGSLEYKRKGIINICSIDGCDKHVVSHGLCDKHRVNLKRNGTPESTRPKDWGKREKHPLYIYWLDTKKRQSLNICDEWKNNFWLFVECVNPRPSNNHYLRAKDTNTILSPDNWQWVEGLTEANRKILAKEKRRNYNKNRLILSTKERDDLLNKADHTCQICGVKYNDNKCPVTGVDSPKTLCIDHCHETGKVRGVLCRACNSGLGHFKDDVLLLERATVYLNSNTS